MTRWHLACAAALLVACGAEPPPTLVPVATVQPAPAPEQTAAPEASAPPTHVDPIEAERKMIAAVLQAGDDWNPPGVEEVSITAGDDGVLDVRGRAYDIHDVSQFARRANESPVFRDVVVVRFEAANDSYTFHLRMRCIGRHLCAPEDVQRIWWATIVPLPKQEPEVEVSFPVPHTMKLVGIVLTHQPRVLLVDQDGFGWIVRVGDTKGGEKLLRVGADHAVFRSVADGTEHRLQLSP